MGFKFRISICLALACLTAGIAANTQESDKPQYGSWGIDLTAMDRSVKPGDNFNRYASGAWLARTEIPADKPMASLRYVMSDLTEARLHELMEKAAAGAPAQPMMASQATSVCFSVGHKYGGARYGKTMCASKSPLTPIHRGRSG